LAKIDTFTKILYVVVWSGCTIPFSGRNFEDFDAALSMAEAWSDKDGIRIEVMKAKFEFATMMNQKKILQKISKNEDHVI